MTDPAMPPLKIGKADAAALDRVRTSIHLGTKSRLASAADKSA